MKKSQLYSLVGFITGWGAPLGALGIKYFSAPSLPLYEFVGKEWEAFSFFYWYMTVGTCLVFTLFGHILGRRLDLEAEKHVERVGS